MTRLTLRIDFDASGSVGPGKIRLLEFVRDKGSISAAGRAMDMSYRRAWLLVDALNQAPSVNDYADNLLLAWQNAQTPAEERVAYWQTSVVEECRASRDAANQAFNQQAAGESAGASSNE